MLNEICGGGSALPFCTHKVFAVCTGLHAALCKIHVQERKNSIPWEPAYLDPCLSARDHLLQVEAVEAMVEDAGQHNVSLDGLAICLGPDLRAMYPLVMNFGVAGELAVSGPAHPDQVGLRQRQGGDENGEDTVGRAAQGPQDDGSC